MNATIACGHVSWGSEQSVTNSRRHLSDQLHITWLDNRFKESLVRRSLCPRKAALPKSNPGGGAVIRPWLDIPQQWTDNDRRVHVSQAKTQTPSTRIPDPLLQFHARISNTNNGAATSGAKTRYICHVVHQSGNIRHGDWTFKNWECSFSFFLRGVGEEKKNQTNKTTV